MKTIVELSTNKAIEALKKSGHRKVYYKSGVWNPYEYISVDKAIKGIENSDFGADVRTNGKDFYVSCPCGSDMW